METYDYLIIGGGIFGIYAALYLSGKNQKVLLIEKEQSLLKKASIVNQARLHGGYHYPRSIATARIADNHKERFTRDHQQFINFKFEKYYAIEKYGSFTDAKQFKRFCDYLNIKAKKIKNHPLFDLSRIEELFLTEEYSFDPIMIAEFYRQKIQLAQHVKIKMNCRVVEAEQRDSRWLVRLSENDGKDFCNVAAFNVINATYCGTNTINKIFHMPYISIMHEITEMAMISSPVLQDTGLTIMDGHFCSLMPYGLSGLLSLSSVTYTHHKVSYEMEPVFDCQEINKECKPDYISICNSCVARPSSNYRKMIAQVKKYLHREVTLHYIFSMFTIKSKLQASYIDDGRPTEISKMHESPGYYCLFAGKINSIYEIEREVQL
jgi:hypothetical protein